MRYTKTLKVGDTGEPVEAHISNKSGRTSVDLTGAIAKFLMYQINDDSTSTLLVDAVATPDADPTTGKLSYNWIAGDTDVPGAHQAYFVVTYSGGVIETYPRNTFIEIRIEELDQ